MTNEIQKNESIQEEQNAPLQADKPTHEPLKPVIPFGIKLQSTRENLGMDRKDVAARLRLTERIITMMEEDKYPSDLPPTFIRGYIRSYGKLLQLPENEIDQAIEPIIPKDKPAPQAPVTIQKMPLNSGNNIVQFFTYALVLTLLGLAGGWWHSHNSNLDKHKTTLALNPIVTKPVSKPALAQVTKTTPEITPTPVTAPKEKPVINKPLEPTQQMASKSTSTKKISPQTLTNDDSIEYDDDAEFDDPEDSLYIN